MEKQLALKETPFGAPAFSFDCRNHNRWFVMSVVSVQEISERRNSRMDNGVTTHRRAWRVICDDMNDGTAVALFADDGTNKIPAYGEAHNKDSSATLRSLEAMPRTNDASKVFIVEAQYSNESTFFQPEVDPLSRAPEISYDSWEMSALYSKDESNPPLKVASSAGQPFNNGPTRNESLLVISIVRNEAGFDAAAAAQYSNTVNSDYVSIEGVMYAPNQLRLSPLRAQKVTERFQGVDKTYYRVAYTLTVRADGWFDILYDSGTYELDGNGKLKPIFTSSGTVVQSAYPLDGAGHKKPNPTDTAELLSFKPYKSVSFATLLFE